MEKFDTTEKLLESQTASLTRERKDALWSAIETDISTTPIPSPFLFSFITQKHMAPIALALILMLGVGGTAYASNEARPGDLLFPIDQALEEARLALTQNDTDRARLQIAFAEERLVELRSILAEDSTDGSSVTSNNSTGTVLPFKAEADVFTDTTFVKVEMNDRTTTFESKADTRAEVIDEIVTRFDIARATVEATLDFEVEDRASRPKDSTDTDTTTDSSDDKEDTDSSSDDSDDTADDSDERVRVEVRVEDGMAEVRMEYNGTRDEFETAYIAKTALIEQLALRSGLSESVISDNLDLEIK